MKYIKRFITHSTYQTYINSQDKLLPNISLCENENEVHYNSWIDPVRFVAKFKVTATNTGTSLFNNPTLLSVLEIDGVKYTTSADISSHTFHQFSTPGIHTVKYTLTEGITSIGTDSFTSKTHMLSLTIPNTITTIATNTFAGCSNLKTVIIPSSVTSIGESPFIACNNLISIVVDANNSVYDSRDNCNAIIETATNTLIQGSNSTVIPNTVTSIGTNAFNVRCYLTNITIPSSVISISGNVFTGCYFTENNFINNTNLDEVSNDYWGATIVDSDTDGFCIKNNSLVKYRGSSNNVVIPNTVTSIGPSAFNYYISLTDLTIPNSVTSIGNSAFIECTSLTNVEIPNSVTSIDNSAFYNCFNLTSMTIGNSVTSIGNAAFQNCYALTNIIISNSVTSIGNSAFYNCTGLTSMTIGNSVTSIGSQTFSQCSGLTSITIPDSVTSIGSNAFSGCTGITKINSDNIGECIIPSTITSIGSGAFSNCSNITSVTINSNSVVSKTYTSSSNLRHIFGYQITEYVIGSGITAIGDYAFNYCSGITSITLPNTVTNIKQHAFEACSNITTITIPSTVTEIGMYCFNSCTKLANLTMNGKTTLKPYAFNGCSALTTINCLSTTAATIDNSSFRNIKTGGTLYVPKGNTGYDVWMGTGDYYLGKYNWTKNEVLGDGIDDNHNGGGSD